MKLKVKNLIFISLISIVLMSCESFDTPQGTLIIKVYDENNNPAKNADIYLYNNEINMLNDTKKYYAWKITDTIGIATFKRIETQTYWISCKIKNTTGNLIKISDSVTVIMDTTIKVDLKP